jgi:hypothetical protein
MGFFEDMFDSRFMFDSEHKQRRDIESLAESIASAPTYDGEIRELRTQVARLQLLCNGLVSLIERKQLATREELEVAVQQIDLYDGREDGVVSPTIWRGAPRCEGCGHCVNPDREACIYCARPVPKDDGSVGGGPYRGGPNRAKPRAFQPRLATCAQCQERVPQQDTFFTDDGHLLCTSCFRA